MSGATTDKYDRQLRLWGSDGQRRLGSTHVLLLKATAVGTETLKNLVLPGVGRFTIVDDAAVGLADVSNNFFVSESSLGRPRAEVAAEMLAEMNDDVEGAALVKDPVQLVSDDPAFVGGFGLVVATGLSSDELLVVARACEGAGTPLISARAYGLVGCLRILVREHCVMDSKSTAQADLRVANPFPALRAFVDAIDLGAASRKEYKHFPYVVMLVKLADEWRSAHGGALPSSFAEKQAFRAAVKAAAREPWGQEENLHEALKMAYFAFGPRPISGDTAAILGDARADDAGLAALVGQPGFAFWAMAKAMRDLLAQGATGGLLPLPGQLPDMTSDTSTFIQLQQVYQAKATEDRALFSACVDAVLSGLGADAAAISPEERAKFCLHANSLRVCRHRSLQEELDPSSANKEAIAEAVMEGVGDSTAQCPLLWYVTLRACDRFHAEAGRYPGSQAGMSQEALDEDAAKVWLLTSALVQELGVELPALAEDHAHEMVRYGAGELHNVAALIGGVASQEAVKLITAQYVPLNNVYVWNGITCAGSVYAL